MLTPFHKVSLKKVRTGVVRRKHVRKDEECKDEDEEHDLIMAALAADIRTAFLPRETQYLSNTIGIVESGRKLSGDCVYVNQMRSVSGTRVLNHHLTRSVSLLLENNSNCTVNAWQYTVKRLESYGDLEMAVWARKIKKYNETYKIVMDKYFDMLNTRDPEVMKELKKAKRRAVLVQEELENSNTHFIKSTILADRNSANWISMTFSEDLIKGMGFTVESLRTFAKEHGIPNIYDKDCDTNSEVNNLYWAFLETGTDVFQTVTELQDIITLVKCPDGSQMKMIIKTLSIIEPTPEGILKHCFNTISPYDDHEHSSNSRLKLKAYKYEASKEDEERFDPFDFDQSSLS